MPGPIRRSRLLMLLPLVTMPVPLILLLWTHQQQPVWFSPGTVALAAQLAVLAFLLPRLRRIRRAFKESGGRLCVQCGHSLAGLADTGVCPECGAQFDIERDRETWAAAGVIPEPGTRARELEAKLVKRVDAQSEVASPSEPTGSDRS